MNRERLHKFKDLAVDDLDIEAKAKLSKCGIDERFHWPLEFPEVFQSNGFNAIVGNPPFRGGKLITGTLGTQYREHLVKELANNVRGHADLCAYFFLRATQLVRLEGVYGLIATNTISQGETREVGLDQLARNGCSIMRAIPNLKWPGSANLEVSVIWATKTKWTGTFCLNDMSVAGITPFLVEPGFVTGRPNNLLANKFDAFQGTVVLGLGFTMLPDEAQELIAKNKRNKDVLFPYLTGKDLNSAPDQSPSRWVINFQDFPLDRGTSPQNYAGPCASDYPDCLEIVRGNVKPARDKLGLKKDASAQGYAKFWWKFARRSVELYRRIANFEVVVVACRVSKYVTHSLCQNGMIYDVGTNVIACDDKGQLAVLESNQYEKWVREYGSTLESRIRYILEDCFVTYPFPTYSETLRTIGKRYHDHRRNAMLSYAEGLTTLLNRFHDPADSSPDIQELRILQTEMDIAVNEAYGWTDLRLDHGFHATPQGVRFTIGEKSRLEVLQRLLKLNHERYAEEVVQGLHDKKKKSAPKKRQSAKSKATSLPGFGDDDEEG